LECKKFHDACHFRKTYIPRPRPIRSPIEKQEHRRKQIRDWRKANPDLVKDQVARQRAANPEAFIRKERRWREKHGDKARAIKLAIEHNRRARKVSSGGTHTPADLSAIMKSQNHRCVYCDADLRKVKCHVDHIQPLARGGSNDKTNLQYTCSSCNVKKNAKDPIAFAQELGRLL
jgi:5-methylcytosine-specific restriction endonuclease McrA